MIRKKLPTPKSSWSEYKQVCCRDTGGNNFNVSVMDKATRSPGGKHLPSFLKLQKRRILKGEFEDESTVSGIIALFPFKIKEVGDNTRVTGEVSNRSVAQGGGMGPSALGTGTAPVLEVCSNSCRKGVYQLHAEISFLIWCTAIFQGTKAMLQNGLYAVITSYFQLQSVFSWGLIRFLGGKVVVF